VILLTRSRYGLPSPYPSKYDDDYDAYAPPSTQRNHVVVLGSFDPDAEWAAATIQKIWRWRSRARRAVASHHSASYGATTTTRWDNPLPHHDPGPPSESDFGYDDYGPPPGPPAGDGDNYYSSPHHFEVEETSGYYTGSSPRSSSRPSYML